MTTIQIARIGFRVKLGPQLSSVEFGNRNPKSRPAIPLIVNNTLAEIENGLVQLD